MSYHLFSGNFCRPLTLALFASIVLISGCGVPGPGGSGPDFSGPDRIGGIDNGVIKIPLSIEATPAMMRQAVSPDSEAIIVADDINCSAIDVIQLSYDFKEQPLGSGFPGVTSKSKEDDSLNPLPGCMLEFTDNFETQVNVVIKVEYPNGNILYSPLRKVESEDQSLVVSFGKHLVLKKLFNRFTSNTELSNALPCRGAQPDCETQHQVKARLLNFIADTSRLYEYPGNEGIEATDNLSQALTKLETQADFVTHIETAVFEITRSISPMSKGTVRQSYNDEDNPDIDNGILRTRLQPNETYNSVLFKMGVSDSETLGNLFYTASSHLDAGDTRRYPQLQHKAYYLEHRYDDILPDIPFEASQIRLDGFSTDPIVDSSLDDNRYVYLTNSNAGEVSLINGTHFSSQGFFLNDRALNQTITAHPTMITDIVGHDFNPVYYKLYRVNDYEPDTSLDNLNEADPPDYGESPTWLMSAGFGRNAVYDIEEVTAGTAPTFERRDLEESQYYLSWEVHGLQTLETIDTSALNGKDYDVLEFSIELDRGSNEPMLVRAETLTWDASNTTFGQAQDGVFYQTRELARLANANVVPQTYTRFPAPISRQYQLIDHEDRDLDNNPILVKKGLVYLDSTTRSKNPLGHVSDNGNYLAFAIDEDDTNDQAKRGIILAMEQRSENIALSSEALDFTLSGHYLFMNNDGQTLVSVNNSTLSIVEDANAIHDCIASLQLELVSIVQRLDPNDGDPNILAPVTESKSTVASDACSLRQGEVEIDFTVDGQALKLRGFAASEDPGSAHTVKLINLLWLQDDALGLVFAQVDQQLNPEFDE